MYLQLFTLLSSARFTADCSLADYVVDVSIVDVRIKRTVPIVDNVDSTIIISAVSIVVSPIMSAATTFIVDLWIYAAVLIVDLSDDSNVPIADLPTSSAGPFNAPVKFKLNDAFQLVFFPLVEPQNLITLPVKTNSGKLLITRCLHYIE